MKTLLSWSGGKDSALALQALLRGDEHEVVGLMTTATAGDQRVTMHGVRLELVREQARLLGLPLLTIEVAPAQGTIGLPANDTYEPAMLGTLTRAREDGIEAIAFGDIYLEDLRDYRESILRHAGLEGIYPLWKRDTRELLEEFIGGGWRAVIVCTDGERMPRSWSGREIDAQFAAELPGDIDCCGERGEFHSFVYDGPLFSAPVAFGRGDIVERPPFAFCELVMERAS